MVEAGMILGLTAAGVSESDATAAVFIQRLFTSYLPPIWGWAVLVWMRKKDYLWTPQEHPASSIDLIGPNDPAVPSGSLLTVNRIIAGHEAFPIGMNVRQVPALTPRSGTPALTAGRSPGLAPIMWSGQRRRTGNLRTMKGACINIPRVRLLCPRAPHADTHVPARVDDEEYRQCQVEDHSGQRQEDAYHGGAGLEQHC